MIDSFAWYDVVGLVGTVLVLLAYFGLQSGKLKGDGVAFQLANIFGAGFIAVSLVYDYNRAAMAIELAWIGISLYGLVRGFYKRAADKDSAAGAPLA